MCDIPNSSYSAKGITANYSVQYGDAMLETLNQCKHPGRVVRKPINANPGLKVNRGNNFSYIKVLSIAYILCRLRLLMLKTEGQKI